MSNTERFNNWLKQQNDQHQFARAIKDGTTVYFSDELAACYDMMIAGLQDDSTSIVIEFESDYNTSEDFIQSASEVWVNKAGWEMWYVNKDLQWMLIADEDGRRKYKRDELIQSKRINFEFKLEQIQ